MTPSFKPFAPYLLIAVATSLAAYVGAGWPELEFKELTGGEFFSKLGTLLVFALLIERTVEVFITVWRSEESYKREGEVRRIINSGGANEVLKPAQERLIEYKTATQRWALPSSFILGLLLSSFGVRVIGQFVHLPDHGAPNYPTEQQLLCFHVADIVLTAALLAGGADPIHKFMDAIRKFMEATAAKASGTVRP